MNKSTKGLLLRVGIDSGADTGGDFGPVFKNGQFEYIPISGWEHVNTEKYCEHKCREINHCFGQHWSDFLKPSLAKKTFHHDPIFDGSWTYGECPTDVRKRSKDCQPTPKMRALEKLQEGDLLVFTAGLKEWPEIQDDHHHIFIIGYLRVKESIPFYHLSNKDIRMHLEQHKSQLSKNAHVVEHNLCPEKRSLESSVIVIGREYPKSQLLTHAMRISRLGKDSIGRMLRVVGSKIQGYDGKIRNWTEILGITGSIQRSTPRWIDQEHIKTLAKELEIPDP